MLQPNPGPIGKEKKSVLCDANYPHSNTGVLRTQINVRPDNLWCILSREHRPDFKGITGEESSLDSSQKWKKFCRKLFRLFSEQFTGSGITFSSVPEKGKNFYEKGFYLRRCGKELASICYDGKNQNGTFLIILSGQFCSLLDLRQWRLIHKLLARFHARLTRFDLAVDDYYGKLFNLADIEKRARLKKSKWFLPIYRGHGIVPGFDKHEVGDSFTLYIGSKDSTIQVCVYEKGKEAKNTYLAKQNPAWIRYEVRFKAKKSTLDLKMTLPQNWVSAAAGSSIYLNSKMKAVGDKFTMANLKEKECALDAFCAAYIAFQKQWGGFVLQCDKIGLEVPRRRFTSNVTPYGSLTIRDKEEILKRIDSVRLGVLRSIAQRDESTGEVLP